MTDTTSPSTIDFASVEGNRFQMDRLMTINFINLSFAAIGIGMLADRMDLYQTFLWTALAIWLLRLSSSSNLKLLVIAIKSNHKR